MESERTSFDQAPQVEMPTERVMRTWDSFNHQINELVSDGLDIRESGYLVEVNSQQHLQLPAFIPR